MSSTSDKVFITSLGLGLASSSLAFWGNVGLRLVGTVPIVSSATHRARIDIDHRQAAKLFAWFYRSAAPLFVSSISTTVVSLLVASRNLPVLSPAPRLSRLLHASALSTALMIPTTLLLLAPINKRLLSVADEGVGSSGAGGGAAAAGKVKELSSQRQSQVERDLESWVRLNDVRMTFAGIGWGLAAYAAILV